MNKAVQSNFKSFSLFQIKFIDLANCSKTKNCQDSGGCGSNNFDQKELILVEFYHSSSQSFALFVFDCHLMFFKGWHAVACPQSVRSKLMILYISFLLFSSLLFSSLLFSFSIFHYFVCLFSLLSVHLSTFSLFSSQSWSKKLIGTLLQTSHLNHGKFLFLCK